MCDYSLEMYGSRPAREGETYVTTRFPSGSIGFAAPGDPNTAVCMQCDTELVLAGVPDDLRARYAVGGDANATFAQIDAGPYRDGVRLPGGQFVSLQELRPGVRAHIPVLLENRAAARRVGMLAEVD